jgi:hypothetical protein
MGEEYAVYSYLPSFNFLCYLSCNLLSNSSWLECFFDNRLCLKDNSFEVELGIRTAPDGWNSPITIVMLGKVNIILKVGLSVSTVVPMDCPTSNVSLPKS